MTQLKDCLRERASAGLISLNDQVDIADMFNLSIKEIEKESLANEILPVRYKCNDTISVEQQSRIFNSKVVLIGCGGLGSYVLDELARLGIGNIVGIDPGMFLEDSMSRQHFCNLHYLGKKKIVAACDRVCEINPAVEFEAIESGISIEDCKNYFNNADVIVDAGDLDICNIDLKIICEKLMIPLVQGSFSGLGGIVRTYIPWAKKIDWVVGKKDKNKKNMHFSFYYALVATLEVAEVYKILIDKKIKMKNRSVCVDVSKMRIEEHSY